MVRNTQTLQQVSTVRVPREWPVKVKRTRFRPATHRRYYKIADITIQIDSDLPITGNTFHPKFDHFRVDRAQGDIIRIRHHFSLPRITMKELGNALYRQSPWAIYKKATSWVYIGINDADNAQPVHRVVYFNSDHTRCRIYNDGNGMYMMGNSGSLTLFPTDQIFLSRVLVDRQGCFLHACGVDLEGKGLLFVGHSGAGKSTMAKFLRGEAEILCDDRMIVRRQRDGYRIYGTWSHGEIPEVSSGSAPLRAICFLEKSKKNRIIPMKDTREITQRIIVCLVRPFVTADWWNKSLALVEHVSRHVPCYRLQFDKSGDIVAVLRSKLIHAQ